MSAFPILLALYGVLCLVALGMLVRWEHRRHQRQGKRSAWLRVRLATIPIALATAAPLFWFGAHWVVGRFARPPLRFSESAAIAGSPIVLAIALAVLAHQLQPLAWSVLRAMGQA
jgi:hypothetical protein